VRRAASESEVLGAESGDLTCGGVRERRAGARSGRCLRAGWGSSWEAV
jgi:hypothetical protein